MHPAREPLLSEEEEAEEGGFEKEGEDSFHGKRHSDDAAGAARELSPVGAELELHGDSGDHAEQEVHGEDPGPEAGRDIVLCVARLQRQRLQHDDEQRQAHGELGEEVVIGDGEGEVDPVKG